MSGPLPDPVEEGRRLVESATEAGVLVRLIGGVAVRVRCPSAAERVLARSYRDVDLVGTAAQREALQTLMEQLGYRADVRLNILHGRTRQFFWDPDHYRQVDVFLDTFEMCHSIELGSRLSLEPVTVPLSDLLLTKLQVIQTNEKDYKDILALLVDHPLVEDDGPGIGMARIARVAGHDWGLWRTVSEVVGRAQEFAASLGAPLPGAFEVQDQVAMLLDALDRAPKSRRWRARSWVGDRIRWYELPEDTVPEMEGRTI